MRLAGHDLNLLAHAAGARCRLNLRLQTRHRGHHKLDAGAQRVDARRRLKKPQSQMPHLRLATARQDGHHVVTGRQPQGLARRRPVCHFRNHLRQRVPDIGGSDTVLGQQRRLKRKNAQHVVDAAANHLQALRTPRPD